MLLLLLPLAPLSQFPFFFPFFSGYFLVNLLLFLPPFALLFSGHPPPPSAPFDGPPRRICFRLGRLWPPLPLRRFLVSSFFLWAPPVPLLPLVPLALPISTRRPGRHQPLEIFPCSFQLLLIFCCCGAIPAALYRPASSQL